MKYKNILVKELYSSKYRNRIKRSKKGKGSFKRLKKVKFEDWKKGRKKGWDVAILLYIASAISSHKISVNNTDYI